MALIAALLLVGAYYVAWGYLVSWLLGFDWGLLKMFIAGVIVNPIHPIVEGD